jgi:hypothetical protein
VKLVEAVIALTLGVLLLLGTWYQAMSIRRQAAEADRVAADWEARRVTGLSLDLDAEGIVGPAGPNEWAVRAFRWWGIPCSRAPAAGAAVLSVSGLRRPDSDKDSLLLIDREGRSRVGKLKHAARSTACSGPALEVSWLPADGPEPVLVRGFERGAYRIDRAFRYRRGTGGAQPLTAERFVADSVGLWIDEGRAGLRISPLPNRFWTR